MAYLARKAYRANLRGLCYYCQHDGYARTSVHGMREHKQHANVRSVLPACKTMPCSYLRGTSFTDILRLAKRCCHRIRLRRGHDRNSSGSHHLSRGWCVAHQDDRHLLAFGTSDYTNEECIVATDCCQISQ